MQILMNVFVYQEYTVPFLLLSKEWPIIPKYVVLHNVADVLLWTLKAPTFIGLCTIYTSYIHMKWLLYQEFNLSQGTCGFLEKLLILFRHFILQFMYFTNCYQTNSGVSPKWHWSMNMLTQKFLKRPVSVVNASKQQLYQHCKIKCLTKSLW